MKIVLSVVLAMLIVGCSDEKSSQKNVSESKTESVVKEVVKQEAVTPQTKVEEVAKEAQKSVEKSVAKSVEKTEKVVAEVEKKVEESTVKIKEAVPAVAAAPSIDGAKLFAACASCHGTNGEKKALGKSQVIQGWDAAKITAALQGYKDGTYGGAMKGIMQGQASKLSDADIKALAEHISKL